VVQRSGRAAQMQVAPCRSPRMGPRTSCIDLQSATLLYFGKGLHARNQVYVLQSLCVNAPTPSSCSHGECWEPTNAACHCRMGNWGGLTNSA
jgi:hypothetical protein